MSDMKKDARRLDRRAFLGVLGAGIGGACLGLANLDAVPVALAAGTGGTAPSHPDKRTMRYDASKCVGCHYCEGACKNANGLSCEVEIDPTKLPEDVLPKAVIPDNVRKAAADYMPVTSDDRDAERWLRVVERSVDTADGPKTVQLRHSCTHCGLCAKVCPSKALAQRADGIVTVDPGLCIGCHYCYQACPFDIPRYRDGEPDKAVQKCIMCWSRVDDGEAPACVADCPTGALSFGCFDAQVAAGQAAVKALASGGYPDACLYGAAELGGIGLVYVLPYSPETYGLPELPLG
mgnify:CR=1 FL=1